MDACFASGVAKMPVRRDRCLICGAEIVERCLDLRCVERRDLTVDL